MKRKIFISVNIREKDKRRLAKTIEIWHDFPVKWTKEQNFHVTIAFLGHIADDSIGEICEKVRNTVKNNDIFDLEFYEIILGPTAEKPQLVWLNGKISDELRILQENIEKSLGIFVASKKIFRPHITLGRIRKNKWEAFKTTPRIFSKFSLIVPVESIEVMASDFSSDGPEYTILESCPLS